MKRILATSDPVPIQHAFTERDLSGYVGKGCHHNGSLNDAESPAGPVRRVVNIKLSIIAACCELCAIGGPDNTVHVALMVGELPDQCSARAVLDSYTCLAGRSE